MRSAEHRPRRWAAAAILIWAACAVAALGALPAPSMARRGRRDPLALKVLHATNIARIGFGGPPAEVIRRLDFLLGRRPLQRYHLIRACTVDHVIAWPGLAVFFRRRHFVGYSYRPANGARPRVPTLATAKGLRVGDTLTTAKRLYGRDFHASKRAGGSWWASTPRGRLGGLASGWPGGPRGSVATIAAGRVGCPGSTA